MDNRIVDVTSKGRIALRAAIGLLVADTPGHTVRYWEEEEDDDGHKTLILSWGPSPERDESVALPVPLDSEGATQLVEQWLANLDPCEMYGEIDGAGACRPEAFRVFCGEWGHVLGRRHGTLGVQGNWAWYSK